MYVIDCLGSDKQISCVKLSDNFFSEQIEHVMLEALNKNTTLTEVNLSGNRFSHSCLTKLKKIT
jgi:Ran GTPase-activating protein (RanGAP) involved in mRNA processing and transport